MVTEEIEKINRIVRSLMHVYEFRISPDHLEFAIVIPDEREFEKNFEKLRLELKKMHAIPMVRKRNGELLLIVVKSPQRRFFSVWVNVAMLIATIISTIWVGMGYYVAYYGSHGLWNDILGGLLYFSVPLLTILGFHEMGHYLAARKHNISASLPFFIPAPTMLGTLGAFISIREPIPDKKSLIDVGLSGPIVGFIVAIPVTIIGLILGAQNPPHVDIESVNTYLVFNVPLIYEFLEWLFPSSNFVHPVSMAGWVGFVVTAINLFPIGQLDGGHAVRAILGDRAKYVSYAFAALLIGLGLLYPGWLFFGLLVLFLGLRHPPPLNDIVKLDRKRIAVALAGLVIFSVTFVPVPVEVMHLHEDVRIDASLSSNFLIIGTEYNTTVLRVNISNHGEMRENITLNISGDARVTGYHGPLVFSIDPGGWRAFQFTVYAEDRGNKSVSLLVKTKTGIREWRNFTLIALETTPDLYFQPDTVHEATFNATLTSRNVERRINFVSLNNVSFNITNIKSRGIEIGANESVALNFIVLGSTVILAVDYERHEAAVLTVVISPKSL